MQVKALRAGLYERVSTGIKDMELSRSVDRQNEDGRAAVNRYGWRLAARYADPGLSASRFAKKERPDWKRMMGDVRSGHLDVVVLWMPDRGSRKLTPWSEFLDACRDRGVLIHIVSRNKTYDLRDPWDWKSLAEEGIQSASESDNKSIHVTNALAKYAQQGEPHGRIPYGYTRRYVLDPTRPKGHRGIQEPHPDQAPIVREIITRIAQGHAISALIRDLHARGIPAPTGAEIWAMSSIRRMVMEGVVYIGKRRHNDGPLIDGDWPPLVDEDVYWAAVTVLNDPRRLTHLQYRGGGIRPGKAKWLLSYIATCGKCGYPLSVTHRDRASGRQALYRCASSVGGCAYAPVEWMDKLIVAAVVHVCGLPGVYAGITEGEDKEALAAQAEADAERNRLAQFESDAISGAISSDSFARISAGIEARIAELEARAEQATQVPELRALLADSREAREEDILARWEDMPIPARRRVVQKLFAPTLAPTPVSGNYLDIHRVKLNPRFKWNQ